MKTNALTSIIALVLLLACKSNDQVNNTEIAIDFLKEKGAFFHLENMEVKDYITLYDLKTGLDKEIDNEQDFEKFKAKYESITIDENSYSILEGDILFDEDELYIYYQESLISKDSQELNGFFDAEKLVAIRLNNDLLKIDNPTNITYSIIKSSFEDETKYHLMVELMNKATNDWAEICNVKFNHLEHFDEQLKPTDNPSELSFVLREFPASGKFIAKAFFPYYQKRRKKILIDPSFYITDYSKAGILRHELGHALGFKHEHIRSGAPAECPNERTSGTVNLTDYDPKSVMHYFCGGVGSKELEFSELDKKGAQLIYGPSSL